MLNAAYAEVVLEDGTTQPLNLIRTRIGAERDMELLSPNARSIAHRSAHNEIVAAFDSLQEQIGAANSLYHSEV